MVLNALGQQLAGALAKLSQAPVIDEETVKATLNEISRALFQSDVAAASVVKLKKAVEQAISSVDDAAAIDKSRVIEKAVFDELCRMVDPGKEPFKPKKGKSNVIMFVGLQGAGKTTTVAKYAHYYQQRKYKVAMVCADTFRAGAFDQLKQNATRVRVPFYGSYTEPDPVKIASEGVQQFKTEHYDIIIVDTSGRHMQESALFAEMEQVASAVQPDDIVFVMDGSIGQAAQAQASAFKKSVPVGSVIITKLDGHAKGGGALAAVAATGSPIIFLGTGEHFDDLATFDAKRFVGKLLGRGDVLGFAQELKEKGILDAKPEMLEALRKGKFSFRDYREQMATVMKMGSLSKLAEMMPGQLGQMMSGMMGQGGGDHATQTLKRQLVILDSMTADELDGVVELTDTRAKRIVMGSGVHPNEFNAMMAQYKQMEKMLGGMSKSGLLRNDAALSKAMKRDPKAVMAQLQKTVDPNLLARMGGPQGMMKMMEAMEGKGGGPGAGLPGVGGGFPGMPGMPGGGMPGMPGMGGPGGPSMQQLQQMMQQMMGGGGGGPRGGGMPAGMAQMMKAMGLG